MGDELEVESMKTGIELIAEERERQISQEGWTAEHDDHHDNHEIALAAAAYAVPLRNDLIEVRKFLWPWSESSFKWTPSQRVRELSKAGALIAAEIDRISRLRDDDETL